MEAMEDQERMETCGYQEILLLEILLMKDKDGTQYMILTNLLMKLFENILI